MSSRLEQFIKDHKEEFDSDEPSKKVWENVREQLDPRERQEKPVVRFNFLRWSAAAAVVILTGAAIWFYINHNNSSPASQVAASYKPERDTATSIKPAIAATPDSSSKQLAQDNRVPKKAMPKEENTTDEMSDYKEEMYHYAKLIEIKHNELKKIEKDEPLLYKKFSGDVHKLDSVYHTLQKQLPQNTNREQVLEAMIQNLQLQIGLLNHQLLIIKQINHSKKSAYEKAYKSA